MLAALALCVALVNPGCGEKIQAPVAQGIPTSSRFYLEKIPWNLTDPTDVLESEGRILVAEGSPGTVTKYETNGDVELQVDGLVNPVAMAIEPTRHVLLVGETGPDADGTPRLSFFSRRTLDPLGSADLSGLATSLGGVALDTLFVYVSDPDSGVVHRFRRASGDDFTLEPQGLVCDDAGSRESPNYVFRPTGLALDEEGMLLICDADTTRNWVLRFDPTPQTADPSSRGVAVQFRPSACPTNDLSSFVLGRAPGCGEAFVPGPSAEPGGLHAPWGVAVDSDGRAYVADVGNSRIQRFTADGRFDLAFGGSSTGGLVQPLRLATWDGIWTGRRGSEIIVGARVYVADRGAAELRIFEDKVFSDLQEGSLP